MSRPRKDQSGALLEMARLSFPKKVRDLFALETFEKLNPFDEQFQLILLIQRLQCSHLHSSVRTPSQAGVKLLDRRDIPLERARLKQILRS